MKNIGFVGLGNMGKGMSINLSRKDDLKLIGFDINGCWFKWGLHPI